MVDVWYIYIWYMISMCVSTFESIFIMAMYWATASSAPNLISAMWLPFSPGRWASLLLSIQWPCRSLRGKGIRTCPAPKNRQGKWWWADGFRGTPFSNKPDHVIHPRFSDHVSKVFIAPVSRTSRSGQLALMITSYVVKPIVNQSQIVPEIGKLTIIPEV